MKIQQIRNACVKIIYPDVTILMDPWLQDAGAGFSAKALKEEMQGVKTPICPLPFEPAEILQDTGHCLVTHVHADHFTPDHIPMDMHIIAQNEKDKEKITGMGFMNVSCFEAENMLMGQVLITKVPARHGDNDYTAEILKR